MFRVDVDSSPVLDALQVADLMALDHGRGTLYARFVSAFLEGAEERMVQIRGHAESADAAALGAAAHAFRGVAGNVGAARLGALLERIEIAAARREIDAAKGMLTALDKEYHCARQALLAAVSRCAY